MNQSPDIQTAAAIIGAGTAGMSAYRAALEHTPRVLVIESGVYGTTCARVGCMPSRLPIAAAEAAHAVPGAARFGVMASASRRREHDCGCLFGVQCASRTPGICSLSVSDRTKRPTLLPP